MTVLKARKHFTHHVIVDPLQCVPIEGSLIMDNICEVMDIYCLSIRDFHVACKNMLALLFAYLDAHACE